MFTVISIRIWFLQRKPNYLWWWLIYQGVFVIVTAGIVIVFIRIRDERYGLLSYLKNYLLKLLITLFISIYLSFVLLLIYFWLSVLSLYTFLRKYNQRKAKQIVTESHLNLTENMKAQGIAGSSGSIQLIPLNMVQSGSTQSGPDGENAVKESGKFFILHVWSTLLYKF